MIERIRLNFSGAVGSLVRIGWGLLCCAWVVIGPTIAAAQGVLNPDPDLIIRNVMLIDPGGQAEDRRVDILIRAHRLELISEDRIPGGEAGWVIDARNGFILGKLELGDEDLIILLELAEQKTQN